MHIRAICLPLLLLLQGTASRIIPTVVGYNVAQLNTPYSAPRIILSRRQDAIIPVPAYLSLDNFTQRVQQANLPTGDDRHSETLNPERHPRGWVALGDSFSAGPGAGDDIDDGTDCMRGANSYPLRMQANNAMPGPVPGQSPIPGQCSYYTNYDNYNKDHVKPLKPLNASISMQSPVFTMKACTGDVLQDLLDQNNPNFQLDAVGAETDFVTLSIGGNDVDFFAILKKCVFGIGSGDCDGLLSSARDTLYGQPMIDSWFNIANGILNRMAWTGRGNNKRTAILQVSYSQFFDAHTDQCDSATFLPVGFGPTMTKDLRIKLNRLVHEVNYQQAYWIDLLNFRNSDDNLLRQPFTSSGFFVDADQLYTGHRFCRNSVTEPDRNNEDTWFYHLFGKKQTDPQGTQVDDTPPDIASNPTAFNDTVDKYFDETGRPGAQQEWLAKTFHPTSRGMDQTASYMIGPVLDIRGAAQLTAQGTIDVMVVGGYVAFASQDPASPIYQGIIPHLKAIFRDNSWYSFPNPFPSPPPPHARVNFIGSQGGQNLGNEPHETYPDATIDQLHQNLRASVDLHLQQKVVILMAGTKDLLFNDDPVQAAGRLAMLIQTIFDADSAAAVLLGHIPMIGINDDGRHWLPLQRRVVEYNARLSAMSDQFLAEGYKVLKVHTTATTMEHLDNDWIRPNTKGYLRMAYDFAEALAMANAFGWLEENVPIGTPGDVGPLAPADTDKAVCSQMITTRAQGDPSPDDIINALRRDQVTEDDFINNVACKFSEICELSLDGVHGGSPGWEGIYQNATTCVYAGGQKDGSDYNQLAIRTPGPGYVLDDSASCKAGVQAILDDCVKSGQWYGGSYKGADGMVVELKNLNYPRSSTVTLGGNAADLTEIDGAALQNNTQPTNGLPAVDESDFPQHPVFV